MTQTAQFRKKPVVIEAMQWDGRRESVPFAGSYVRYREEGLVDDPSPYLWIKTLDSVAYAFPGDWVIRGTASEHYPCTDRIFREIYEPVVSSSATAMPTEINAVSFPDPNPPTTETR